MKNSSYELPGSTDNFCLPPFLTAPYTGVGLIFTMVRPTLQAEIVISEINLTCVLYKKKVHLKQQLC